MQPEFTQARYELITRHALALAGVLAAEIHLRDSESGPLRRVASSVAPPAFVAVGQDGHATSDGELVTLLDTERLGPFFDSVISGPSLHHIDLMPTSNGRFAERRHEEVEGPAVARLVAGRIQARGEIRGLMVFVLDHVPLSAERRALDDFIAEARRVTESRMAGRDTSSVEAARRLESVLQLAEAPLVGADLKTTLRAAVETLRDALHADLVGIILADETSGALHPEVPALSPAGEAVMKDRVRSTVPAEPGVTGWVARNLRPTLIPDVREDVRVRAGDRREAESVLAVPLIANGKLTGVLRVGAVGANRFGESDLRLVEVLARQTSVIVEHARMQDRMRQQNESLAMMGRLVEASSDAILLVDPLRRIAHCNPATESLFGYEKAELVGQSVAILGSEGNLPGASAIHQTLMDVGDWAGEITRRRKDGSEFPAEVRINTVFGDDGERIGFVEIVRDLTRRKAWEAEQVQSEKLRSLGVMAAGVAHEVNNSLASVLGQADLLLRLTHEPEARRCLEAIITAAEDGAGSVRRIRDFARPSSDGELAPVDLSEIARDVLAATAPRWRDQPARHGRPIDARLVASSSVWTLGAVTELREALTNLVINAVDALPSGGSIRIDVKERNERAVLAVSDTGTGMTEDVKQRVFDPFFTTKPFGQGTGLGLALVYGIVERHRGEIRISSRPGKGTTFEIDLPAIPPPGSQPNEAQPFLATEGLRILVVEDEAMLAEQLRSILSLDGHSIRVCSSGAEALDALNQEFDLVITDLGMPGIGGRDVAAAAKARFPNMRVGVVTGWAGDLLESGSPGGPDVDFVVPKPYRIQTIREAVAKAFPSPVPAG